MNALTEVTSTTRAVEPAADSGRPSVSVLVLVAGRPEPLLDLYQELADGVRQVCEHFEFVFVVEQKFLELSATLVELAARGEPIRVARVGQTLGQTGMLREGLSHSRGSIILTLPSRRRVETAALGSLIRAVEAGADVAVARRRRRQDSWANRAQSYVFHALVAGAVGRTARTIGDLTSGVRAMRRDVLDRVPLYGESARFLPLLALRDGYSVVEVPASQHPSDHRNPLPSPLIYLRSLFDLLSLFFVLRFTEKPLRFFGLAGTVVLLPGALILAVLFVQRLGGQAIADRPLLLLGVLFVVLGIQMVALGLIGEIIVHLHAAERPSYRLRRETDRVRR